MFFGIYHELFCIFATMNDAKNSLFTYRKNALAGSLGEPLCSEYNAKWRACGGDKEKLFRLGVQRQSLPHLMTYARRGLGATRDGLMTDFGGYINGKHTAIDVDGVGGGYTTQLYVGYESNVYEVADTMAFMWCDADIDIHASKCPTLYVGCNTTLHLFLDGYNTISIYLFDNSKVVVEDADVSCNVVVRKYSKECSVERGKYCLCGVKEHNKELRI